MMQRILKPTTRVIARPGRGSLLRHYHSYPDPNEVPIITMQHVQRKEKGIKSPEMIQQIADLKYRLGFHQQRKNENEKTIVEKNELIPKITKLDNGLTVVSIEADDMTMSSLVFLVKSGSAHEIQNGGPGENEQSASFFLESTAFGHTTDSQESEVVSKQLHRIGGVDMATSSRENILYFVDVIRDNAEQALKLLASSVLRPVIDENVIQEGISNMEFKYHYMASDILSYDGVAMAAYGKGPLGNRHYPSDLMRLQFLTPNVIQKFRSKILFGENCIVSGSGIEHEVLVNWVKREFRDLPRMPSDSNMPLTSTKSQYSGGLYVEQRELKDPFVKLTIGFEFGGYKGKDLFTACVLERLLGGGSSFSAGGPGKGMYTRLYRDVMCRYDWIESVQGMVIVFENNGLFGIDGACGAQNLMPLFKVMVHELAKLSVMKVTPLELSRAKNMLKSKLLMQLESRIVVGEDLARQVATFGFRESPSETCKKIDEVTAEDIMKFAKEILLSPPSISCIGEDVSQIPPYEQLQTYTTSYRDSMWRNYK